MKKNLLLLLSLLLVQSLHAQLKDLPILYDTVYSTVLNEKRAIEIVMPTGYIPGSGDKYDVYYVTDGEWNTKIVRDIHQFLELQFLPPCIIVSIPNRYINGENQRGRDLSPTHIGSMANSGGGPKYLSFIKNELMPYINKKYPTNGMNMLYGSSLGGLFGLYAFLKEPQLFESYMLSDPAFWWDDGYVGKLLSTKLDSIKTLNKTLFIAGRKGKPYEYMGIAMIDSILRAKLPQGLRWKTGLYENETHNSMMFMTVYDGLKHTYDGYSKETLRFYPANGIVENGKPLKLFVGFELFKDIAYTTDGSEPNASSPRVTDGSFTLSGPAKLTVKSICNVEAYSKKATGVFKTGAAPAPVAKIKNAKAGGWNYTYYEGTWSSLPDFKKLKPVKTGFADKDFSLAHLPRKENFACVVEGQIEIKNDGYYVFGIDCMGGARLSIGNQLIIDYDGLHTPENYQSYVLPLKKGFYPVRVAYFKKAGEPVFNLIYLPPGADNATQIPLDVRYGK